MSSLRAYVTYLSTADYLEGVFVLYSSLLKTNPRYPFFVLVASTVDSKAVAVLEQRGIRCIEVSAISAPIHVSQSYEHWKHCYSKLHVFNQTEFEKVVYLDADMLICRNIDELFDKPHLSAAQDASGSLPIASESVVMTTGLMVIRPDAQVFQDMLKKLPSMSGRGQGDQGFLQEYFPEWPTLPELHLDARYNMFSLFVDDYCMYFGYELVDSLGSIRISNSEKIVKVLHFIGGEKPWMNVPEIRREIKEDERRESDSLWTHAYRLWLAEYDECCLEQV